MKSFIRLLLFFCCSLYLVGCASFKSDVQSREHNNQQDDFLITPQGELPEAAATTLLSPELLLEELDLIRQNLLSIHPQPFARFSENEFQQQFELLRSSINYPLSRSEFYLRVAPLLANLRDIHSFIHLPKDQFGHFKYQNEKLFPLAVILQSDNQLAKNKSNDRLYVAADLSPQPSLSAGIEILSINQVSVSFLISVMKELTVQETTSGQNRKIQMNFAWLLAAMGYAGETYQVEYLSQGAHHFVNLEGLEVPRNKLASPVSYYGFSQLNSSTALLWLNDFNENQEVFESYLQDKFNQMEKQGLTNLILDLRFNSGGLTENLKSLLSKITKTNIYWASKGKIKVSKQLQKNHRHKTKARRKSKYDKGLRWLPLEWTDSLQHSIWWANEGEIISLQLDPIKPSNNFKPEKTWVLTNGFCYSACSFFVASVNQFKLGKTIGEKPGSLARFQFAYPVAFTLPHSRLKVTFPTMRLDFVASEVEDLILPQEVVQRNQLDIEAKHDPVMMRAIEQAELY